MQFVIAVRYSLKNGLPPIKTAKNGMENKITAKEIQDFASEILKSIEKSDCPIEIASMQGSVIIDNNTFDCTYDGIFGKIIAKEVIGKAETIAQKLMIISANCLYWSSLVSGITISKFQNN